MEYVLFLLGLVLFLVATVIIHAVVRVAFMGPIERREWQADIKNRRKAGRLAERLRKNALKRKLGN